MRVWTHFIPLILLLVSPGGIARADELGSELTSRIPRVEEFRFIREEAEKLGVRAWLFGGTAAGYGHYVKWDLEREKGDPRFQPDRFDYDYTNIYRSTQDLDIVVDGSPEKAQALQAALQAKYPHLQGSKSAWEVRLLRQDLGDKQALLDNPDFLNQHTDSNSTGMIELTKPPAGEPAIRDLRDWNSTEPHFLKDLREGALHYYYSPLHDETKFFRAGRNPPIISVIRYLTKAFQYELKLRPGDLAQIKKVIDQFDPKAPMNSYVSNWIEKNGKKLIQNAVNIEYAVQKLDELGLRKKLGSIKGNRSDLDSLSWWMNKEPLRTQPLGTTGKTAREIFEANGWAKPGEPLVVAHEANQFLSYESITRAPTGDPNVLISRRDVAGEAALHGNGYYTRAGRTGARGTGLTIRFTLEPNAREGTDFIREGDYIIIQNKAAIRVIPESLNIGLLEYFDMLIRGDALTSDDKGILEKLKRRMGAKAHALSKEDERALVKNVRSHLTTQSLVAQEWFSLPISQKFPEFVEDLIKDGNQDAFVARYILSQPHWKAHPELVEQLIKNGIAGSEIGNYVLSQPHWKDHPELIEKLIKSEAATRFTITYAILHQPHWRDHPELRRISGGREPTVENLIAGYKKLEKTGSYPKRTLGLRCADLFRGLFR